MNKQFLGRIRVMSLFCILIALIIVGRLYLLQVVRGSAYAARADAQFVQPEDPLLDRGTIYFTDKNGTEITAATLKDGSSIAVNPTKVVDPEGLYNALKNFISMSQSDFIAKATKGATQYQLIAQHLTGDVGTTLESMQLPGLIISQDRWRFYPGGSLAAQDIGFVAYDADNSIEGRYGLERQYNQTLERSDTDLYTNFFVQLFAGVKSVLQGAPQQGDIVTTIEPSVQEELEHDLVAYDAQWHPKLAGGIIMNPQNGEIYAMAVSPTFDLNNFGAQTDPSVYANPMVSNIYEMGSIMKPLTMAAGIDSGAITASTTYDDVGCITVDKSKICNFDFKGRGVIPMQIILNDSLNVGASFIATRMGSSTMRDYFINHYQLGSTTGIDMPDQQAGIVSNLYAPEQVDYDTAAFGQGIALSPVTMIRALAVLANGGYLVTPHFVRSINYDSGISTTLNWPKIGPVLKPQTTETVTKMLVTVVDVAFLKGMSFPNYSVAAKTGTAQIADPATGAYYPDTYVHSYFGYFPASNPKFIIFLFGYEPVGAPYSSETWGAYFHSLVQFLINYYDVPPDR